MAEQLSTIRPARLFYVDDEDYDDNDDTDDVDDSKGKFGHIVITINFLCIAINFSASH